MAGETLSRTTPRSSLRKPTSLARTSEARRMAYRSPIESFTCRSGDIAAETAGQHLGAEHFLKLADVLRHAGLRRTFSLRASRQERRSATKNR